MAPLPRNPIRIRKALQHMGKLLEDPDDTRQVFHIIDALSGNSFHRVYLRVRRHPAGKRLLRDKPNLLSKLLDRDALRALPEGSVGRAYLEFVEAEGITAEGLVEASETGRERAALPPDTRADLDFLSNRMRDQHDLWHAVTGYHGDLLGELSLLAFTFAQTRNPGVGFIVAIGYLIEGGRVGARPMIAHALRQGLRARFFPVEPWEELLSLPLEDVRRRLNVEAAPDYVPLRSRQVDVLRRKARSVTGVRDAA
jgi:ubiquinone biosynthesis protein COQ4